MASEQTGVKKKHLKSTPKEEQSLPILYRHQDCIPSVKLLQNCEKNNSVGLKSNLNQECCKRLDNRVEISEVKNNKRKSTPKVKNNGTTESNRQNVDIKHINGSDGGQDEVLSRSRKRRLRKQKLLESLVSSSTNNIEPSPPIENNTQIKSIPIPHANSPGSAVTSSSTNITAGEPAKTSPKDPRKRPDKSGSRNKNIKSKALAEQTSQAKTSLIKTLEEKTLNSLLQTLAPFAHKSPRKEKPSPIKSPFSFPENRLLASESKADKDGVFYFGETKHQLEKLTAELNKSNQSLSLAKEKSDIAQVEVAKARYLDSALKSLSNSIPQNNISFPAFDQVKTSTRNIQTNSFNFSNKSEIENITAGCSAKNEKLSLNTDQIVIPKSLEFIPSKELESFLITAVKSLEKPLNNSDTVTVPETSVNSQVSSAVSTLSKENLEGKNSVTKMKLEDQPKSNKTREEILKEREAKKAAKLAAKTKHKPGKSNEEEVKDGSTSKIDSSISIKTNSEAMKKEDTLRKIKPEDSLCSKHVALEYQKKDLQLLTDKLNAIEIEASKEQAPSKSKSELRAERRAKQEAQRAVKAAEKEPKQQTQMKEKVVASAKSAPEAAQTQTQLNKKSEAPKSAVQPKPKLFGHLYQEKTSLTSNEMLKGGSLHPAVVQLGVQYSTRVVVGSNARCVALLCALKQVVNDYTTPSEKEFSRGLEEELGLVTRYLHQCRPLAVSMTNALRHIKRSLTQLPNNITDKEARSKICDIIDQYIHEQIDVAGKAICNTVKEKIMDGDVVLTYGCSSLVYQILVESHMKGTKFRVVVVDGRPWLEGREMLRRLVNKGLSCTYVLITAASFIMREATKVLLGAHALLANGCVMSRAGSSQVALLAHCNNVPVLVCCETHKFSERVQTDAFVYNEIGELCCDNLKERERLTALSLAYDITPPDLVSAVVTELAVLPCTSVPVILRIKPSESVI